MKDEKVFQMLIRKGWNLTMIGAMIRMLNRKSFLIISALFISCLLLCSCRSNKNQETVLGAIVSIEKGYFEPVEIPFGTTLSEALAKPALRNAEYDPSLNRLIGTFEHQLLSEPAIRIINFSNDKVCSVEVVLRCAEDLSSLKEKLQKETEEYIPVEWQVSAQNEIAVPGGACQWVDAIGNTFSVSEPIVEGSEKVITIRIGMKKNRSLLFTTYKTRYWWEMHDSGGNVVFQPRPNVMEGWLLSNFDMLAYALGRT